MNTTKLTIGYVRVSTSKQLDGNGPDQQRAAICAWAVANNVKIDDWVTEDESGTKEDREEILKLLERAKAGEIGALVIDRQDRLGRRLVVSENLTQRFAEAGVEVISTVMRLGNAPTDVLVRQIMGSIAEFQRSEWLARMRTCRKIAVTRKGRHSGGKAPLGYKSAGNGKLAEDTKTSPIVRRVFALADADLSIHAITRQLNAEGHRAAGKEWFPMQVKRIIDRRAFYAGKAPLIEGVAYERGVKPCHPPLIGDRTMHGTGQEAEAALMDTGS
jgi:DNA invertase Pin-like site-specific DNA recombinase